MDGRPPGRRAGRPGGAGGPGLALRGLLVSTLRLPAAPGTCPRGRRGPHAGLLRAAPREERAGGGAPRQGPLPVLPPRRTGEPPPEPEAGGTGEEARRRPDASLARPRGCRGALPARAGARDDPRTRLQEALGADPPRARPRPPPRGDGGGREGRALREAQALPERRGR